MVKTVAVGFGRVFVGALKILGFVVWYSPQIAFWSVLTALSNLFALAFSIRVFNQQENEDVKIRHYVVMITSCISWVVMVFVLSRVVGLGYCVDLALSTTSLPIPFTGLGIPLLYILYTLLATNLISFFYEIGRLGKNSDSKVKPSSDDETEENHDLVEDFLELLEDIQTVKEMTRELAEKWYKKIEDALKRGKIDLRDACHLKQMVDNGVKNTPQESPNAL